MRFLLTLILVALATPAAAQTACKANALFTLGWT